MVSISTGGFFFGGGGATAAEEKGHDVGQHLADAVVHWDALDEKERGKILSEAAKLLERQGRAAGAAGVPTAGASAAGVHDPTGNNSTVPPEPVPPEPVLGAHQPANFSANQSATTSKKKFDDAGAEEPPSPRPSTTAERHRSAVVAERNDIEELLNDIEMMERQKSFRARIYGAAGKEAPAPREQSSASWAEKKTSEKRASRKHASTLPEQINTDEHRFTLVGEVNPVERDPGRHNGRERGEAESSLLRHTSRPRNSSRAAQSSSSQSRSDEDEQSTMRTSQESSPFRGFWASFPQGEERDRESPFESLSKRGHDTAMKMKKKAEELKEKTAEDINKVREDMKRKAEHGGLFPWGEDSAWA